MRLTGRVQVNLWDAEPGYTVDATYLGKKKTLAIGASIDTQSDVAVGTAPNTMVDYDWTTVDVFVEWPVGVHPSKDAPEGLSLVAFRIEAPEAEALKVVLDALDVAVTVRHGPEERLVAELETPKGPLTLGSLAP